MTTRADAGFSLIELLLVVVIIGVLVQILVPNYRAVTFRARAADLVGRIDVVAEAAHRYESDEYEWPAETAAGEVPSELVPYLPDGFSFTGEDYVLDWENVPVPGGLPGYPSADRLIGVGVVTDVQPLGEALVLLLGERGWYNVGDTYVRILTQ